MATRAIRELGLELLAITKTEFVLWMLPLVATAWLFGWVLGNARETAREKRWRRALDAAQAERDQAQQALQASRKKHRAWLGERDALRTEASKTRDETHTIASLRARVDALTQERDELARTAANLESDVADVMAQWRTLEPVRAELAERDATIAELTPLRDQLAASEVERERLAASHDRMVEGKDADIAERDSQIERLHARLEAREKADAAATPPPLAPRVATPEPATRRSGDDLQRIHGIGKVLAGRLNTLGYHTFADVAHWKRSDVERVAASIHTFPDRIDRDRWVEQARTLAAEQSDAASSTP